MHMFCSSLSMKELSVVATGGSSCYTIRFEEGSIRLQVSSPYHPFPFVFSFVELALRMLLHLKSARVRQGKPGFAFPSAPLPSPCRPQSSLHSPSFLLCLCCSARAQQPCGSTNNTQTTISTKTRQLPTLQITSASGITIPSSPVQRTGECHSTLSSSTSS
jgi:hypothetical protein